MIRTPTVPSAAPRSSGARRTAARLPRGARPPVVVAALAVILASGVVAAQDLSEMTPWRVTGGRLQLHLYPDALEAAGLEVRDVVETATVDEPLVEETSSPLMGFAVRDDSDLLVLRNGAGHVQPYGVLGGAVRLAGGFVLAAPDTGRAVDLHELEVHARWVRTDGPGGEPDPDVFHATRAGGPPGGHGPDDLFRLCYAKVYFADYPATGGGPGHLALELRIRAWDLIATRALAQALGKPELEDRILGHGRILSTVAVHDGPWELPPGQNVFSPYQGGGEAHDASSPLLPDPALRATVPAGGAGIDMELGGLQSLVVLGHDGDFPTGRTGFALTTIACNVGTVDIPWLRPMDEEHPGIGMALYRELDGRFEQVGVSWIKHGFFAQSNSSCTPCQSPGGGLALGVGCSDTYGSANNGDRFWLGPRSEWDAHTAEWTCLGSFFDGTPVDCERDEDGATTSDVDHRLEAFDVDLANPGATYWYEAFYMVEDDVDPWNNIASRRTVIVDDGGAFFATTPTTQSGNPVVLGPAIQRWGQKRTVADLLPDDGRVILAAQVTPLSGGLWRYEYALFNWSLDRRVESFAVPLSQGLASLMSFHDIDAHGDNDWVPAKSAGNLRWTFPGVFHAGHKVAGPLEFGTLYNFGFTSDRPPAVRDAVLAIHEDGPGGDLLLVETFAPDVLALTADSASPVAGGPLSLSVIGDGASAVVAALSLDAVPFASPLLVTPAPVRFAAGEAPVDLVVPAALAGSTVKLVALELDAGLSVSGVSNVLDLAVR